ncbi:porin [Vibrio plantisponsor]|uniref:Porin n=1 Tax=Vibrio plantisponsor TaxID=664643 RepID=A0ABU4IFK7_9VIBR|nr:porin [Vibrio plantisponsor]MDW6016622.1 porin [Vibrio plantisponsor]NNM40007.1 porin [Vibrio plantisponsor]
MKKTLLALAVFAAAGSAQAIELYNQDGVTVQLKGDIEVRYKKTTDKEDNLKQEIDDADIGFDTRYQVNDDFQIGGYIEYSGDSSDRTQGTVANGNTYVGFYSNTFGSLKFGKLDTVMDDAGIGNDYMFGISSFFGDDLDFGGEEAVRYDYDAGAFYFSLGYNQDEYNNHVYNRDSYFDAKVGARVAGFDFTVFHGQADVDGASVAGTDDISLTGVEVRYGGIENLNLEFGYYATDLGYGDEGDTFGVAADYTMDAWSFSFGVSNTDFDLASEEDFTAWFVNAGYGIAPNTTLYAEIGGTDEDNTETAYGFGVKAFF